MSRPPIAAQESRPIKGFGPAADPAKNCRTVRCPCYKLQNGARSPAERRGPGGGMGRKQHLIAALAAVAFGLVLPGPAVAQKPGGVLRVYHRDSPASMSLLEEATLSVLMPVMGVFNNLVIYDQHVAQNSLASVRPELATEWSWNEDRTELIFRLRRDVRWHDGKPFTAADVKCTWDLPVSYTI
jgi:ABC-type transport system substrate-binding protein